ncbi:MAG: N-acetyltransferase [Desulfovibrio sp.]|nr:N-acetyltransferase [Desulfovibrio sp.]
MDWGLPSFNRKNVLLPEFSANALINITIRSAKASDVNGMSALINSYASKNVMLARGPQYLYQHLQDYIVATANLKDSPQEYVIGCGALHILWYDLAEIRSLAVHDRCHHLGLGKKIVQSLIDRSAKLEIPRVFCFTLVDTFFQKCGFTIFSREELPPVVWAECSKCPKFFNCDEISLLYLIK